VNLQTDYGIPIQNNVPLCRFSTLQIGGPAAYFAEPGTREAFLPLMAFQKHDNLPVLIIGRGSNILFSDEGFSGLVISLRKFELDRIQFSPDGSVKVSAGMSLFRLSALCQEQGMSGLEFVCHIPGTVGGACAMNAGFGRAASPYREIKDVLRSVTILDLLNSKLRVVTRDEIKFEYRKSSLDKEIVLDATFQLTPSTREQVRDEVKANFTYRNSVQDLRYPSAGSVFKNPKKPAESAGKLIDRAGLRGTRIGGAMISEKHGNFILNVGNAKAVDVLQLIDLAKSRVFEQFGVELEPEVKLMVPGLSSPCTV